MSFRDLILHNFRLKMFSVVAATVIWFAIHNGIQNDRALIPPTINHSVPKETIRVSVTEKRQPGDPRVFTTDPKEVYVEILGEQPALDRAKATGLTAYVDLTGYRSGILTNKVNVPAPLNVRILEITPPEVTVEQISP